MNKPFFLPGLLAVLLAPTTGICAVQANTPIGGLIERIAPGHTGDFIIETIPAPPGENVFEVGARDGKIVLRGDNSLSQAVALNWYLKHDAFVDVSWFADEPVNMPRHLPLPAEDVRQTTRIRERFFLNYCTFGYTMPFWHWRDWERCIDWMALNGINLPLAQTGNEYIWQKVWRGYGLSDEAIRAYFTGPAYLPWHRMVNIDHWGGPLPQSFIDGQHDLQQQILARERELGMSPVLCAFAGHVPEALKASQPDLHIERIPPGGVGFPVNTVAGSSTRWTPNSGISRSGLCRCSRRNTAPATITEPTRSTKSLLQAGNPPIWPAWRAPFTPAWRKLTRKPSGCKWPGPSKPAGSGRTSGCRP